MNKMKPILFSTPMVIAILDGCKTQTRRLIKDKDIINNFDIDADGSAYAYINPETGDSYPPTAIARYQPGGILWVRETWCKNGEAYLYKAGCPHLQGNMYIKWHPSIHMPREAARIFLRVTNVRVERLQDINEEDALKEGCMPTILDGAIFFSAKGKFHALWDSLSAKRGYGWETNPWVWVYEFERVSEIDQN